MDGVHGLIKVLMKYICNGKKEEKHTKKENEQLKREKMLLVRFIRRNHDVSMVSRILKEGE